MTPHWYMGDLLTLAHDLADRLIIAFDETPSGIPHPRVNLKHGIPENGYDKSCTPNDINGMCYLLFLMCPTQELSNSHLSKD